MNKQIGIAIAIIAVVVIGAVLYLNNSKDNKQVASNSVMSRDQAMMTDDNTPANDAMMTDKDKMMSGDKMNQGSADKMMPEAGSYKSYSAETVKLEQAAGNKVVLFFHASWCPFCKTADKAFTEGASKIPTGVTILKTDYDSNSDLKTKYGVTTQHTFVQIDNSGSKVTAWVSGDIDSLVKNIK